MNVCYYLRDRPKMVGFPLQREGDVMDKYDWLMLLLSLIQTVLTLLMYLNS